jgi:hypothetical protein
MSLFSDSNTPRFRTPSLEDPPQEADPHVAPISYLRVICKLKCLASVVAGIYVQRSGIGDISKVVVIGVGALFLGENAGHLVYNSFFSPKFPERPSVEGDEEEEEKDSSRKTK